jgi:hypothetical protein
VTGFYQRRSGHPLRGIRHPLRNPVPLIPERGEAGANHRGRVLGARRRLRTVSERSDLLPGEPSMAVVIAFPPQTGDKEDGGVDNASGITDQAIVVPSIIAFRADHETPDPPSH